MTKYVTWKTCTVHCQLETNLLGLWSLIFIQIKASYERKNAIFFPKLFTIKYDFMFLWTVGNVMPLRIPYCWLGQCPKLMRRVCGGMPLLSWIFQLKHMLFFGIAFLLFPYKACRRQKVSKTALSYCTFNYIVDIRAHVGKNVFSLIWSQIHQNNKKKLGTIIVSRWETFSKWKLSKKPCCEKSSVIMIIYLDSFFVK